MSGLGDLLRARGGPTFKTHHVFSCSSRTTLERWFWAADVGVNLENSVSFDMFFCWLERESKKKGKRKRRRNSNRKGRARERGMKKRRHGGRESERKGER